MPPPRPLRLLARAALLAAVAACLLPSCGGGSRPTTVVLVTIDTLRRDAPGAYGGAARTPRLDALAARGALFLDARTPAPLTLPAHATMFTGLPPARHGVRSNSASRVAPRAHRPYALLAEAMAEAGRRCGAFVSAGPLASRYGLDAGFETYDDAGLDDRTSATYAERAGSRTVERALAWVSGVGRDREMFLWVHLFEPHEPHPPAASVAAGYRADVEAADAALGFLLEGLRERGRGDAVVCVTADHGEALGDLGEPSHGFLLVESVLRVPLLFVGPGVAVDRRADPADLADVAPTLLALAGAPWRSPGGPGSGRALFPEPAPAGRVRFAESLHAHHQMRWAQLTCAVAKGRKVEDRGGDRRLSFPLADTPPYQGPGRRVGEPPAASEDADAPARDAELLAALGDYRRAQAGRGDGPSPATAPKGYGAGGEVGPLLEPDENGALADPYEVIEDATRLSRLAATYERAVGLPPSVAREALGQLDVLDARDPRNPSIPFWRGRFHRLPGSRNLAAALAAFEEAAARGRTDVETLYLTLGTLADLGRGQEALSRLERVAGHRALDTRIHLLERDLRLEAGDSDGAARACAKAREAAQGERDRARLAEAGCR